MKTIAYLRVSTGGHFTVYAFHKKYDYGIRALVEAQNSRIKRCIGGSLKTQRTSSQKNEWVVIANLMVLSHLFSLNYFQLKLSLLLNF